MSFEIYYEDLKSDIQQALLEYYGIQDVYQETNWDIEPLAIMEWSEE